MSTAQRPAPRPAQRTARSAAPRTAQRIFSSSCAKARRARSESVFRSGLVSTRISARARTWDGFEQFVGYPSPLPSPPRGEGVPVIAHWKGELFVMTSDRTCSRTCDRNCVRNHLVTMYQFVSMFAKAQCAIRKPASIIELRRGRQYQPGAQGHKKSQFGRNPAADFHAFESSNAPWLPQGPILRPVHLTPAKSVLTYSSRIVSKSVLSSLRLAPLGEGKLCRGTDSVPGLCQCYGERAARLAYFICRGCPS